MKKEFESLINETGSELQPKDLKAYSGIAQSFEYVKKYLTNNSVNNIIIEFSCTPSTLIDDKFGTVLKWTPKNESGVMSWGLGAMGNTPVKASIKQLIKQINKL